MNKRPIFALITLVLLVLFVVHQITRPLSAQEVADKTKTAIEGQDVQALLDLTMPDERQKLGMDYANVAAYLRLTLYARGRPGKTTLELHHNVLVDQPLYTLTPVDKTVQERLPDLPFVVNETPDGHWYLALGYLLLCSAATDMQDRSVEAVSHRWISTAKPLGIKGSRLNTTGYNYFQ